MERQPIAKRSIEIVERKGLGHPDTICDMLSEQLSIALSRHYMDRFGLILHHNVDKALSAAGRAEWAFGGGKVTEPIDIYLSGRATTDVKGEHVLVEELAHESSRTWFTENFHALDPDKHVRVHCLVRPGSRDLVDLFLRQREEGVILANDTACGVGFAPLTSLEKIVLEVEQHLNSSPVKSVLPVSGEDIKVMGIREDDALSLTISCAFIARYLDGLRAYAQAKEELAAIARDRIRTLNGSSASISVNAADDLQRGSVYVTVTGTSAESGDDGETGRGNRASGLITPFRPMTLEAIAGKNPVNHVGKLYNLAAQVLTQALVQEVEEVLEAECYLVSQIGAPIDRPRTTLVRIRTEDGAIAPETARAVDEIASRQIAEIGRIWHGVLEGRYHVV
jgi:S-adenosylmethionine synthetase